MGVCVPNRGSVPQLIRIMHHALCEWESGLAKRIHCANAYIIIASLYSITQRMPLRKPLNNASPVDAIAQF